MKKQADAEESKIFDIQSSLKETLEKIYPYTKYDDYEEVKKKGEPIRKRIREINDELRSINFSQNITTISSSIKKSFAEQEADEKIRKAKDKEENKVKTQPLEKELNELENNPDYEKLIKYELTTYNPEFKKFVKEITDRLNEGPHGMKLPDEEVKRLVPDLTPDTDNIIAVKNATEIANAMVEAGKK
jgi:hypothetical protein